MVITVFIPPLTVYLNSQNRPRKRFWQGPYYARVSRMSDFPPHTHSTNPWASPRRPNAKSITHGGARDSSNSETGLFSVHFGEFWVASKLRSHYVGTPRRQESARGVYSYDCRHNAKSITRGAMLFTRHRPTLLSQRV